MAQAVPTSRVIKFGVFEVDLHKGEVRKNGLKLRLRGQPFRVLSILLEHPGKIVTREEFQQRLWTNDETFVDFDHGLNAIVNRLREVLGDSPENPHFIETVPRRGYRWMLPVEGMEDRAIPASLGHKWLSWVAALLVVIVLVGGILIFVLSTSKTPDPALTSVPLTARLGYESLPSFSPDGNQVAFGWSGENESESHIYVKLIGTDGPPLQLTTRPGSDNNPVWSPDGRFIAFLRDLPGGAAILLIPALGGPAHKIAEIGLADVPAPFLAWSPDGNSLVTSHRNAPKGPAALFVVAINTGEKRRLTSPPSEIGNAGGDTNPIFSPDGRTLAFVRTIGLRPELYLLSISDALQPVGEAKRVPLGQLRCFAPAWTEDGREIVISCEGQGLLRIGVSGSKTQSAEPARLPFGDNAWCPAISRRGHRLAYSKGFFHLGIRRMAAPGGPSARDVPGATSFNQSFISSTRADLFPQFSPDGKRIAFVSSRSGNLEIWVCNSDASNPVQLTFFHGPYVSTPRWSPDGGRIAFDSDAGGGEFDIWVIDANGGKPMRMTTHPANDGNPSWSHDGRWIYFDSLRTGEQEVWKMPADGGEAIQLTWDRAFAPLESPDGKFLYYTKELGASRQPGGTSVWKVPLGGGQASKVLERLSTYNNLAIVGKGIYFIPVHDAEPGYSIQFLDLQTKQIRRIASFESPLGSADFAGLSISPDGRWILYTQADRQGAELTLVENFH
jgi:Tol biopolymer transport system component/DNA-binding winged helix-turn-helix (wHTH) protein